MCVFVYEKLTCSVSDLYIFVILLLYCVILKLFVVVVIRFLLLLIFVEILFHILFLSNDATSRYLLLLISFQS
jgi:hypothetical protein